MQYGVKMWQLDIQYGIKIHNLCNMELKYYNWICNMGLKSDSLIWNMGLKFDNWMCIYGVTIWHKFTKIYKKLKTVCYNGWLTCNQNMFEGT